MENIKKLQNKLGYKFLNEDLLVQALTTKPYTIENPDTIHFYPLAALGDTVIKLALTSYAVIELKYMEKEEINSIKERNENRYNLGKKFIDYMDDDLNLIFLEMRRGIGEKNNNNSKIIPNYFGELFEAIIGAIYIDSDEDFNRTKIQIFKILFPDY